MINNRGLNEVVMGAINGIEGDVKLNRALWVMAENMMNLLGR